LAEHDKIIRPVWGGREEPPKKQAVELTDMLHFKEVGNIICKLAVLNQTTRTK
jgi:hypothetical protein